MLIGIRINDINKIVSFISFLFLKQVLILSVLCFKAGRFTYVQDTNSLRKDLATYYDYFSKNTARDEPIISIPYIDAFGTGKDAIYCYILSTTTTTNTLYYNQDIKGSSRSLNSVGNCGNFGTNQRLI